VIASLRHTEIAYLIIGSNLGDRAGHIAKAVDAIREKAGVPFIFSSLYETEPWGFSHETPFINRALGIHTEASPHQLMQILLSIEQATGRIRSEKGYQARTLDIDILFYGLDIIGMADLVIPHPRLCERRFALVPLDEIAPGLIHPLMHATISELLQECIDPSWVRKLPSTRDSF